MKVNYDLLNAVAAEFPGATLPEDESERLAALGELDLVDHNDPALESLCNLLTNLFKVPLAGAHPPTYDPPTFLLKCLKPYSCTARRPGLG
jgi:hypothetical protein